MSINFSRKVSQMRLWLLHQSESLSWKKKIQHMSDEQIIATYTNMRDDVYICQSCGTIVAAYLKECPECGGIEDENI